MMPTMPGVPIYHNDNEDKWFHWKGVAPPKRQSHGITEDQIDNLLRKQQHRCKWFQEGPNAACDEAPEFRHGFRIGVNKRLVGTGENGEPLIEDIVFNR